LSSELLIFFSKKYKKGKNWIINDQVMNIQKKRSAGCPRCSTETNTNKRRKPVETFIASSINVHGDVYIYDEVIYINTDEKVIIKCKEHGRFQQTPYHHIHRKQGYPECGIIKCAKANRLTLEEFIERSNEIHNNEYDYSKVEYINQRCKVIIICKEHGEFEQEAGSHLQGCGCSKCSDERGGDAHRLTREKFLQKSIEIHGDRYIYS
jgi:hypothetical protein